MKQRNKNDPQQKHCLGTVRKKYFIINAVCLAHRGLLVGFLLLRCSVLFTVESLSLLCLLIVSLFVCFGGWCIDKLGVFHVDRVSVYLDPHLGWG